MFDKSAAEVLSAIPNQNPQLVIVRKFSLVHMNMVLQILLLTAVFSSFCYVAQNCRGAEHFTE